MVLGLVLTGSWSLSHQAQAESTALTITVTFWPDRTCGSPGAVVPVGLNVSGPPDSHHEVSAWLYNDGQLGLVWSDIDRAWRWAHYLPITLDGNGSWEGLRHLRLKSEPNLEDPYYLKAKVRNDTTSVEVKVEDWVLDDPDNCLRVEGHAGNGSAPHAGHLIRLRNESGAVVAANVTGPPPWDSGASNGSFAMLAPAGNHTLEVLDPDGTVVLDHELQLDRDLLDLELGWQATGDPDPPDGPGPANLSGRRLLITELAADTYLSGDPDEYLALHNPTQVTVDLTGWSLAEDSATAYFPDDTLIGPGATLRVALDGSAYARGWGEPPDMEMTASDVLSGDGTPLPLLAGSPLRLSNTREVVELLDPTGAAIDTVVYGDATYFGDGWTWPPREAPGTGRVLVRWSGEDTNSSADWEDPWRTLKVGYSRWPVSTHPFDGGTTFVSPDSSYAALTELIDGAAASLDVNLYTFDSPWLAYRLVNASARGVAVRLLLEGSPVGGMSNESLWAADTVASSGGEVRLLTGDGANGTVQRYWNDHAKYLIADDERVAVMSENWNRRGIPPEPGHGNRGWGVILDSPELALALGNVFQGDLDPSRADSVPWGWGGFELPAGARPNWTLERPTYTPRFEATTFGGGNVTLLLSPDSLMGEEGLPELLAQAGSSIWVQQASLPLFWEGRPNPHLEAVVAAAQRGVQARLILDGGLVYNIEDNSVTIDYLNGLAKREGLDLEARLFPGHPLVKVHNKGVIVDGRYVLVGSTNWVRAAAMDNREVSLWLDSQEAADYYGEVFHYDWELSGKQARAEDEGGLPGFDVTMIILVLLMLSRNRQNHRRRNGQD